MFQVGSMCLKSKLAFCFKQVFSQQNKMLSVSNRYFYKEIRSYFENAKVLSIFEESEEEGKLKLKDHITLHLYLNHPPPGDYRECLDM